MRSRSDRASDEVSNFTREKKMIHICCVGSGVKYHSLSHWSIVMTSLVEFSSREFRAKQV